MHPTHIPRFSHATKRFFEILPGTITWTALLLPIILSFYTPILVACFILVFDFYWFIRSFHIAYNISHAFTLMKRAASIDWYERITKNADTQYDRGITSKNVYQAIIIVMYKEPLELLEASIKSYAEAKYDVKKHLVVILATEERSEEHGATVFDHLKKKYGNEFLRFERTIHPKNIPGEIKCKSANGTWAAKHLEKVLAELDVKPINTIVHNFDADTRAHPQYFAYVQWNFLHTPLDQPTSYQPIHLLTNNIWDTGTPMRLIAIGSSFGVMHNALVKDQLYCFSSRSDCFQTIIDIGYWTVDAIPEDSRQYYDSFFHYHGNIHIQPQFIPLYMDAVLADTPKSTIVGQYTQLRRWAWGVVDLAYVAEKCIQDSHTPWGRKIRLVWNLIERHFSWAVVPVYLSIIGWVPFLVNQNFQSTILSYNFLRYTHIIFSASTIGLIVAIYTSYLLLPKRSAHHSFWTYSTLALQWLLIPIFSLCFNAAAAVDAQTRLMLGKYMEYQVTEKSVAKTGAPKP